VPALLLIAVPAAAVLWTAILLAAPVVPPELGAGAYLFGSFICHQIAERSFHVEAVQLPVCARCFGIYAGAAVAAASLVPPSVGRALSGPRAPIRVRATMIVTALPTLVTVALEWAGIWDPGNGIRAIAGVLLGAGVAFAVMAAIHYEQCQRRRPVVHPPSTPI